jgi:hypothetical protein
MNVIRELSDLIVWAWFSSWGISSLVFFAAGLQSLSWGYSVENRVFNGSSFEELILPYINNVYSEYLQAIIYLLAALFCISIVMVSLQIEKRQYRMHID